MLPHVNVYGFSYKLQQVGEASAGVPEGATAKVKLGALKKIIAMKRKKKQDVSKKEGKPKRAAIAKSGPSDVPKPLTPRQVKKQESHEEDALRAGLTRKTCFFNDDTSKRIDFVLVTTTKVCADNSKYQEIQSFLKTLMDVGILIEIEFGKANEEHYFIKMHIPETCLMQLVNIYRTDLSCVNPHYTLETNPRYRCVRTELNKYEKSNLMERAPEIISGVQPIVATNAERAMTLFRLLNETPYGTAPDQFGYKSLLEKGLFIAGYAVHEGTYKWTRDGFLSERQLLARYWASFRMLFKKQPLNLIERYFGTEVGMYFAWLEYYVAFLVPAAGVGVISFAFGSMDTYFSDKDYVTKDVCESNLILCPYCEHYALCPFIPLKTECSFSRFGFLLDNPANVFFSMFMSVWATLFMVMWQRRINMLKLRWNVYNLYVEETVRREFVREATSQRISRSTGEMEPYIPNIQHCAQIAITNVTLLFCAVIVLSVALSVIVYQCKLRYVAHISKDHAKSRNATWIAKITGSIFIALSILVFTVIYEKIALWLTKKECPRTQQSFDRAFIVKNCILNFCNNYAAITYLAFFKGKFFTHPGDKHQWNILGGIATDLCGPGGCLADVGIQLAMVLIVPSFFSCLAQYLLPYLEMKLKRVHEVFRRKDVPQWEFDLYLKDTHKYFLFNEYRDLLIQYGYITCFVCALPIAPLLALIRNLFEIRIDASKFLKFQRRHIATKVDGLGAYNDILTWITYVSVLTNSCVIAFSSNFIQKIIYRARYGRGLKGYVNNTLSVFHIDDYDSTDHSPEPTNFTTCYYHGQRYPPDHPRKYELTEDFYVQLVGQLAFVLIFEHILMLIKTLLTHLIWNVPRFVRERLRMEEIKNREARLASFNDSYRKISNVFSKGVSFPTK